MELKQKPSIKLKGVRTVLPESIQKRKVLHQLINVQDVPGVVIVQRLVINESPIASTVVLESMLVRRQMQQTHIIRARVVKRVNTQNL